MKNILLMDSIIDHQGSNIDIIKCITPKNLFEENTKFLECYMRGIEYNPQYTYSEIENLESIKDYIERLTFSKDTLGEIYRKYQKFILKSIELINNIGDSERFTDLSIELHGKPDHNILKEAVTILKKQTTIESDDKVFDAKYIRDVFQIKLDCLAMDWEIEIKQTMSSKIAVDSSEKKIYINANVMFSDNDITRLLVHEIETHVRRAENGLKQKYGIFGQGFPNSIETEEGLATYNEYKNGVLDMQTLKIYAGRVLAVRLSTEKSFFEVFKEISEYFDFQESLRIVSRVKRGLKNTAHKGGYTKDHVYLSGFYKVKKYLETQSDELLYMGIIGIDDIVDIKKILHLL